MVVEPDTDHDAINNLVSGHIPGAEVNRIHGKELDITLPQSGISNFAGKNITMNLKSLHAIRPSLKYFVCLTWAQLFKTNDVIS